MLENCIVDCYYDVFNFDNYRWIAAAAIFRWMKRAKVSGQPATGFGVWDFSVFKRGGSRAYTQFQHTHLDH